MRRGYLPHFSSRAGYSTTLTLVNFSSETQVLRITAEALQADGIARTPSSATVERTILPAARLEESAEQMFNFAGEALITGYIRFETVGDTSGVVGFLDYGTADGPVLSALEARAEGSSDMLLSPVAEGADYWTALALLNPNREPSVVTLDSFDLDGNRMASAVVNLSPGEREVNFFDKLFQPGLNQIGGYVRATATRPAFALEIFGSRYSSGLLANVAAQGARLINRTHWMVPFLRRPSMSLHRAYLRRFKKILLAV